VLPKKVDDSRNRSFQAVTGRIQRLQTVAVAAATLALMLMWVWHKQIQAFQSDLDLQQRLGQVLAEQAAWLVGKQGRILAIAADVNGSPTLKSQTDAFKAALRRLGDYEVREYQLTNPLSTRHPLGAGLSWLEYQHALKDSSRLDLVVSFAGAPDMTAEAARTVAPTPRLIAECASTANLRALFGSKLLAAAVVPRITPAQAAPEHPNDTVCGNSMDCFSRQYQVITQELASSLPSP
jgi:hypothetical protein